MNKKSLAFLLSIVLLFVLAPGVSYLAMPLWSKTFLEITVQVLL